MKCIVGIPKPMIPPASAMLRGVRGNGGELLRAPGLHIGRQGRAGAEQGLQAVQAVALARLDAGFFQGGEVFGAGAEDADALVVDQVEGLVSTAFECLRNTDLSILAIAEKAGLRKASAFRRAFKQWTGENPGHYRTKWQNNN